MVPMCYWKLVECAGESDLPLVAGDEKAHLVSGTVGTLPPLRFTFIVSARVFFGYMYVCVLHVCSLQGDQTRASDSPGGCEPPCGWWVLTQVLGRADSALNS